MTLPAVAADNPRYASIVMDADTGLILHQRYADKPLHPASLTKIMTLLMVFEGLDQGRIDLNDRVPISRHAANAVPSKLDLPVGSSIKVKDAIYALVTKSANDIAVALAEYVGGTESGFATLMTHKAHEIGMTKTVFKNASGLHNPQQISTARDMAKLAHYVITQYPDYYRYFSTKNFSYNGVNFHNHNRLMETYKGMDGMKTGYTVPSGFNLVASAVRNNHRLIGVVFGGRSSSSRNAHMASLLDNGFARLGNEIRIASAPEAIQVAAEEPAADRVPTPARKPGILVALNSLNSLAPASGSSVSTQKWAMLTSKSESSQFGELLGEGDYDPAASERIRTGLMAISAYRGEEMPRVAALPAAKDDFWSVQIGAFTSRAATDKALQKALKKLPREYSSASAVIAPLKTDNGWLFRARLGGFSRADAFNACKHIKECLPVAPQNH